MKLPVAWLLDYLDLDAGGLPQALEAACRRWDLKPASEPARALGTLFTFAGFACDGVKGEGTHAVLELDVLSNRPDGQCIFGLAREAAAFLQVGLKAPECACPEGSERAEALAQVSVEDPAYCPRYTARIIRGVKVGPSPAWLQARLVSLGLTPRNNVVDVTNFILFELNQPLHAFDLNRLAGRRIVVRRAREREPFTPLYGQLPALTPETLVIADGEQAVAVAGVIGGAGSEVSEATTDLLLEAACFDPAQIRRACRRLKTGTDSSYRFERGVDAEGLARASARAARLIVEAAGGTVAAGLLDSHPVPCAPKQVELRYAKLRALYGVDVSKPRVLEILAALGCQVAEEHLDRVVVAIPSWRRGDLEREVDLIEEVARLHGFNHIVAATAMNARIPPRSDLETAADSVRAHFAALGYFETVSDSLVDPRWPAPAVWTAARPLALEARSVLREDHACLRNSLLPSLLEVARNNQDRRTGTVRLFELGRAFLPAAEAERAEERPVLGALDELGFATLADALRRLPAALSVASAHLKLQPPAPGQVPDFLVPESACRIVRVRETEDRERCEDFAGWLGVASRALCASFDLKRAPAVAELHLAALAQLPRAPRRYRPLPSQPEVVRDVALVAAEGVSWHEIERFVERYAEEEPLRDRHEPPRFLSVFRGKQVGAGRKSVAFSVVYRVPDRSLTDAEVNAAHGRFTEKLLLQFKAALRA